VAWLHRPERSMDQERPEPKQVAGNGSTDYWRPASHKRGYRSLGETTQQMRSRNDLQRSIFGGRRIQVDSERQNPCQNRGRRLRVQHAGFFGPTRPAFPRSALLHRQTQVLVPGNAPIGAFSLVEESGATRYCAGTKQPLRDACNQRMHRQPYDSWQGQQISHTTTRDRRQALENGGALGIGQCATRPSEAVGCELSDQFAHW
jgi:hypothetical protein